jgi:hypothetical protein
MSFKRYNLILLVACVAITSCKKHGEKPTTPPDVYNAGYVVAANTHSVASYWKNGTLVKLGDSTVSSVANGIAVDGSDVYVVGNMTNSEQITTAIIWKNGVATNLTDGTSNADARGITISGNDVYAAGYINNFQAVYWKNGVVNQLSSSSYANAIAVSSGTVYAAGTIYDNSAGGDEIVYWKNAAPTEYILGTIGNPYSHTSGSATAVQVVNGNLYVTGYDTNGKYWKNGVETDLPGGWASYPAGIAVNGSDVYVAGSTDTGTPGKAGSLATYWKNNVAMQLTDNSIFSVANAIAIDGSDIYIGGAANGSAVYWKNGSLIKLAQNGSVYSTFLVSR